MLRVLVARVCLSNVVSERRFQEFSRGIQDQGLWASSGQRAFIGGMSAVMTATQHGCYVTVVGSLHAQITKPKQMTTS